MRTFSRWMPPVPEQGAGLAGWLIFGVIVTGLTVWAILSPAGRWVAAVLMAVQLAGVLTHRARVGRLVAARPGEDIGSFARAFDRRGEPFDPRVIRATWDALVPYVSAGGRRAPIRPADRLTRELNIDEGDLEDVLLPGIAERAGRSLATTEQNPWYGRVDTVRDLVRFVTAQPRRAAA